MLVFRVMKHIPDFRRPLGFFTLAIYGPVISPQVYGHIEGSISLAWCMKLPQVAGSEKESGQYEHYISL